MNWKALEDSVGNGLLVHLNLVRDQAKLHPSWNRGWVTGKVRNQIRKNWWGSEGREVMPWQGENNRHCATSRREGEECVTRIWFHTWPSIEGDHLFFNICVVEISWKTEVRRRDSNVIPKRYTKFNGEKASHFHWGHKWVGKTKDVPWTRFQSNLPCVYMGLYLAANKVSSFQRVSVCIYHKWKHIYWETFYCFTFQCKLYCVNAFREFFFF